MSAPSKWQWQPIIPKNSLNERNSHEATDYNLTTNTAPQLLDTIAFAQVEAQNPQKAMWLWNAANTAIKGSYKDLFFQLVLAVKSIRKGHHFDRCGTVTYDPTDH